MIKRSEILTISAIALMVAFGGLFFFSRSKSEPSSPDPVAAEAISIGLPEVVTVAVEPRAESVELPAQERDAGLVADGPGSSGTDGGSVPVKKSPAVRGEKAELVAGVIPEELVGFLQRGLIPGSEDLLSGSEAARNQEQDARSLSLEGGIRDFLAAQPEAAGLKYLVSCGTKLCEIQIEDPESRDVAVSLLMARLASDPWFRSVLAPVRSVYAGKDGHPYFLGHWKPR